MKILISVKKYSLIFTSLVVRNSVNKGRECYIKSTRTVSPTENARFCIQLYVFIALFEMGSGELILLRVTLIDQYPPPPSREKQLSQLLHAEETGINFCGVIFNLQPVR